ncbi:RNA pseudouridine synthase [uncultured Xylophilus sp.]|uniref:RNA pseudouridine synthase n=1 Tax=uncultured Xylophilus sp. TaxID=296832 RepID=UPI0025E5C485|nr:RNA pseudouridine synthase [uncultured Xylophilus sp.]
MPLPAADDSIRLSRRVSEIAGCSRREAELYIEGGWVRVDGAVVTVPGARVPPRAAVVLAEGARAEPLPPVTLLLHKPAGFEAWEDADAGRQPARRLLVPERLQPGDRSGIRPVPKHFEQACLTPLEPAATGLVVFSQDRRIARKLLEDAALVEHELIVDVAGAVSPEVLDRLNRPPVIDGRAMHPSRVSISRQNDAATGLRFASKGHWPGRIAQMCAGAGLSLRGMHRIRVGRLTLAGLEPGQWRYLLPYERV